MNVARNAGLDILRFFAVFLVLARHMQPRADASWIEHAWRHGGWIGVDLFFVLSGFLVSSLLFHEYQQRKKLNLQRFFIRRGFKIYPPVVVLVCVTSVVFMWGGAPPSGWNIAGELLMIQNYAGRLWNHTWSLAVEWHFYLVLIFVMAGMLRFARDGHADPFKPLVWIFAAMAVVCLALRLATAYFMEGFSFGWFLFGTHIRIDSLFFGVLLAYLWHFRNLGARLKWVPSWLLLGGGALLLSPAFVSNSEDYMRLMSVVGVIGFYTGAGMMVVAATRLEATRNHLLVAIGFLGAASYSIYLWHLPIGKWVWPYVKNLTGSSDYIFYLVVYFGGSILVGLMMNRLVEGPSLQMRNKLFPEKHQTVGVLSEASQTTVPDKHRI